MYLVLVFLGLCLHMSVCSPQKLYSKKTKKKTCSERQLVGGASSILNYESHGKPHPTLFALKAGLETCSPDMSLSNIYIYIPQPPLPHLFHREKHDDSRYPLVIQNGWNIHHRSPSNYSKPSGGHENLATNPTPAALRDRQASNSGPEPMRKHVDVSPWSMDLVCRCHDVRKSRWSLWAF